jgi:hypothetical protein
MVATAGDTALIIVAALWGALVLFLCLVLANTFRVLESTKMTIDAMREETVPAAARGQDLDREDEPRDRPRGHRLGVGRIDRRAGRAPLRADRGSRDEPDREADRLGRRGAQGVRQGASKKPKK